MNRAAERPLGLVGAAESFCSDAAGRSAVLATTTRNATIGFVVLAYALHRFGELYCSY